LCSVRQYFKCRPLALHHEGTKGTKNFVVKCRTILAQPRSSREPVGVR